MKTEKIVEALTDAAEELGIQVRRERGTFRGGLCSMDGKEVILLNRRQPVQTHLAILAESLTPDRVEGIFLPPTVRAALEDSWASKSDVAVDVDDAA